MESRSGRSRSNTPFGQTESFETTFVEKGNHVEETVVRSTRRTTAFRAKESAASSTDEVTAYNIKPTRRSTRSETKSKQFYKTSDYSSEDGENEVSSTKTISQNERNQLIEDARAASNGGSEVSALELYKKSGRYWDVYPKTDWTYSHHSKDRVELAPGVVAMPNMSRKTIHSVHEADSDYAHKETNTESYLSKSNSYTTGAESYSNNHQPRRLFNNNYNNEYELYERRTYRYSRWERFKRSVTTIFTSIVTIFYYMFHVQTYWFSKLHKFTSRVMLWDTWLLWKTGGGNKSAKLVALCLIPLLLLGGWWILSNLGSVIYGAYLNSTLTATPLAETSMAEDIILSLPKDASIDVSQPIFKAEDINGGASFHIEEKIVKVTEKIYVEPPKASEIAAELSAAQLEAISNFLKEDINIKEQIDTESIVRNILHSPHFQTVINNYNELKTSDISNDNFELINKQEQIINDLKDEINKIKLDIEASDKVRHEKLSEILSQFQAESAQNKAYLTYKLNRCCRTPIINLETSVTRIMTKFLNDFDFLSNQKGLTDYLRTIFLAKQDLEAQLQNLTRSLDLKYHGLLQDNGQVIMDTVAGKIKLEVEKKLAANSFIHGTSTDVNVDISDERVKRIVRNALAVYDADRTGLVDYAMETMGGQILTTRCTENYHYGKAVVSVLGIPLWYPVNSPRTLITPSINPGECWAFQNFPGFVVIRLSNMVKIEAFSIEHISKLLVPDGKIDSAPKEFEVYGLTMENDKEPVLLGQYVYEYDGEPLQFFDVQKYDQLFEIVEIRIISNHGNPNYTCLYRFRVHGKLVHEDS